jgi:histone acetyltransferase (RNA polymerase elongator complex component)
MRHQIIPVFIPHASCPQQCVFCNQKKITGVAGYDHGSVRNSIDSCISSMRKSNAGKARVCLREIAFYGGSFTAIKPGHQEALLKIAKAYLDKRLVDSVRVSTRPDCIDEEILHRLGRYGVSTIELGVQSMSDDVLDANLRGHTKSDTVSASKMIKAAGFKLGHQIMPGLYNDTKETMLETIEESMKLKPDFLRVYPCLVVRETRLEELYNEGKYEPLSIEKAVDICKLIYLKAGSAGIKIIRMGIHADSDFIEGGFVAGPFHPAFKHLVISSLFYDLCEILISKSALDDDVTFTVNKSDVSNFVGINGSNVKKLKEKYSLSNLNLVQAQGAKKGSIAIDHGNKHYKANILDIPQKAA